MTEKKLELERQARATTAKLPKLTITPFKGTIDDWIRFESVFVSQVDKKTHLSGAEVWLLVGICDS